MVEARTVKKANTVKLLKAYYEAVEEVKKKKTKEK